MSETAEKLMDLAEDGMRLRGYHAVSFRDLAAALGIKSASVHYHFKKKEDLGVAVVKRYALRFFAALRVEADKVQTPSGRIGAFCRVYRKALTETNRICLCGMLGAERGGLPEDVASPVADFFRASIAWVAGSLPEDMPDRDRERRAAHVVSTVQGAMELAGTLQDHKVFDNAIQDLVAESQTY